VLGGITVPTLVITGHLDRLIVPETARFMSERLPTGQLAEFEPAGHMAVFERHTELISSLASLANGVFPAASGASEAAGRATHSSDGQSTVFPTR
jgi:pimeloyl-ACP methyl ester carboxylesterase